MMINQKLVKVFESTNKITCLKNAGYQCKLKSPKTALCGKKGLALTLSWTTLCSVYIYLHAFDFAKFFAKKKDK